MDAWLALSTTFAELPRALGHSLWQGALVALLVYIALWNIPARRANLRYGVSVAGLLVLVVAVIVTWSISGEGASKHAVGKDGGIAQASPADLAAEKPLMGSPGGQPRVTTSGGLEIASIVLYGWAAGVVLMLVRLVWLMRGVSTLRRRSRVIENETLVALFEEMRRLVGASRRVVLRVADDVVSPVAMGLLWPVVVLPASFASGVPPEQLRAVLAHELAHICRYDYLVNFLQLIVEALLYFNPAMWWLSRQIRIEREACCDAVAARALGDAFDYAEAITRVTRYIHEGYAPSAALTFGAPAPHTSMLDRLRRLLMPEHRPHLRLRLRSVVFGTLFTLAVLLGLYESAVLAKKLLTDEERIAVMADLAEEFQRDPEEDETKVPIAVTVTTHDGSPVPETGRVSAWVEAGNSSISYGIGATDGVYRCRIVTGDAYVYAVFPGFAPGVLGPIDVTAESNLENLTITLGPSYPATVRFVTRDGEPVAGVELTGGYKFRRDGWSGSIHLTSDERGETRIELGETLYSVVLRAAADGFQETERRELLLQPGDTFEWVLQPDEPIRGTVVAEASGAPVAGAEVALVYDTLHSFAYRIEGKTVAVTDNIGQFELQGLAANHRYYYLVHAKGYGSEMHAVDSGSDEPIRVALAPRYVRGEVRGDLSLLKRGDDSLTPIIEYSMDLVIPGAAASHAGSPEEARVDVVDGVGHFTIEDLRAGELFIKAGPAEVRVAVTGPVEGLVIDVSQPHEAITRTLIATFPVPPGAPPAEGRLHVWRYDGGRDAEQTVPIKASRAEALVTVPARYALSVEGMNGYIPRPVYGPWAEDDIRRGWQIPPGAEPFTVEMPLQRAGAIQGQVLLQDGSLAAGANIYVAAESHEWGMWPDEYFCRASSNATCDDNGRFAVLPVPFGKPMRVKASMDFARAEQVVEARATEPIATVQLTLPEGVDVSVMVLDPQDRPMPDVELKVYTPDSSNCCYRTGPDGVFVLRGADPKTQYHVEARPTRDYQYTRVPIAFGGGSPVLRLKEGLHASGVVLHQGTGEPVPQAVVVATAAPVASDAASDFYEVTTIADGEGRFSFTNLRKGEFRAHAQHSGTYVAVPDVNFTAGQAEPIIIHLRPKE